MIEAKNVVKSFDGFRALDGLTMTVPHGSIYGLVGPNGAGKSTMFAAIAGSFITDSGSITLNGKDITFAPEYQRSRVIGRLFQDPLKGTAPHMTIEENLSLAYLRASRGSIPFSRISKKDKEFFREQLSMLDMGLEDRMKQPFIRRPAPGPDPSNGHHGAPALTVVG